MSNTKTNGKIPQVGRSSSSKSHTEKSVCLKHSGGGKHSTKLNIGTYNIRSKSKDKKWTNWRRSWINYIILNSGHIFYYKGAREDDENQGGVGFMINKSVKPNLKLYNAVSNNNCEKTIES